SSPLVTLGVPGSGCVLYGFAAGLARAFLKSFQNSRDKKAAGNARGQTCRKPPISPLTRECLAKAWA
ncbi:hypothetical protein, partial [Halomonas sp. 141]|uniref:hypothetical protein n=1 Tax=Halomonas sp. 141 TaxID=2056666 RepID=UPI001E3A3AFC